MKEPIPETKNVKYRVCTKENSLYYSTKERVSEHIQLLQSTQQQCKFIYLYTTTCFDL
jgi:hypothetical protein